MSRFLGTAAMTGKCLKPKMIVGRLNLRSTLKAVRPTRLPLIIFLYFTWLIDLEVNAIAARFKLMGIEPVAPANPYWLNKGLTFEDPDGWRIVVVDNSIL